MTDCYIESYNGALTEKEMSKVVETLQSNGINTYYKYSERGLMNAAIDELVPQVVMFFSSDYFTALSNLVTISSALSALIVFICKKTKQKKLKKVTVDKIKDEDIKMNIVVDNITILNPKTDSADFEKYYYEAFLEAQKLLKYKQEEKMIVEYDMVSKQVKIFTLEEYAENVNMSK